MFGTVSFRGANVIRFRFGEQSMEIETIVHSLEPITLVGGGDVAPALLKRAQNHAPRTIAADGGAEAVLALGQMPERVIGDLDSLGAQARAALPPERIVQIDEQDSTDFEKCLMRISAPLSLAVGFRGGRFDHDLAALHALLRFAHQRCLLLSEQDCVFLCPPRLALDLPVGTPLSLFPLQAVTGRSAGLQWSFDRLEYAPGVQIGTSNQVAGPVTLEMSGPGMLVIVPASVLEACVTQLAQQPAARWPARA